MHEINTNALPGLLVTTCLERKVTKQMQEELCKTNDSKCNANKEHIISDMWGIYTMVKRFMY